MGASPLIRHGHEPVELSGHLGTALYFLIGALLTLNENLTTNNLDERYPIMIFYDLDGGRFRESQHTRMMQRQRRVLEFVVRLQT